MFKVWMSVILIFFCIPSPLLAGNGASVSKYETDEFTQLLRRAPKLAKKRFAFAIKCYWGREKEFPKKIQDRVAVHIFETLRAYRRTCDYNLACMILNKRAKLDLSDEQAAKEIIKLLERSRIEKAQKMLENYEDQKEFEKNYGVRRRW